MYWSTRPTTVPASSDHYFHTECPSFRPSILPSFRLSVPKLQNQATITAARDCGLAEWIIDDSYLVFALILPSVITGDSITNAFLKKRCSFDFQVFKYLYSKHSCSSSSNFLSFKSTMVEIVQACYKKVQLSVFVCTVC